MKLPSYIINEFRKKLFDTGKLPLPVNTVCEHAKCPNRGECFSHKTLAFLLLGSICTRNCMFCGVEKGKPQSSPLNDSQAVIEAIKHFDLKYVVLTSVTRDDLSDGGASCFVEVMKNIKVLQQPIKIEVLVPDFAGNINSLDIVCNQQPFVFNHNLELVPHIYKKYRPGGNFQLSLNILKYVKANYVDIHIKTGIMVGFEETKEHVLSLIQLLATQHIDSLTIGQYLQPDKKSAPVIRYVEPQEYKDYTTYGQEQGIKVIAGPLVRSSYMADKVFATG